MPGSHDRRAGVSGDIVADERAVGTPSRASQPLFQTVGCHLRHQGDGHGHWRTIDPVLSELDHHGTDLCLHEADDGPRKTLAEHVASSGHDDSKLHLVERVRPSNSTHGVRKIERPHQLG